MTVHRVGPPPEEAPQHRTNLGRVLVTIDDLAALKTFLTSRAYTAAEDIKVEFDGGYFTEPEDLRTLSDLEMESLRLKTPKVQVVLNPSAAFAIGERQEAEDIYRIWARARQTQLRARPIQFFEYLVFLLPIVLILPLIFRLIPKIDGTDPMAASYLAYVVAMAGFGLVMSFILGRTVLARGSSYAVVTPVSLAEHRQNLSSQVYPRRTWIVAIVTMVVTAAVTVGIFILSKIIGVE